MYQVVKRAIDALGAFLLLIPLSVLFLPVIVVLLCTGEHAVFYRQTRIGRGGREFGILKFATMLKDSPNLAGGSLTVRGDPRVLPFGRFLRASKINELPQVINVLIGDMSFVGPRPQVRGDFEHYTPAQQAAVTSLRPGITGIGSVVFRDEERFLSRQGVDPRAFYGDRIAPYKGALEEWYRAHASLRTDALLLWATAWTVLRPESQLVFRVFPDLPARPDWWVED
ncbi:MAG: sugar transferase [Microbacteriaceae bacterium]|nr:sugar transferase [Microbacteriaceae bacterium]